jgi:hypothetical protein
MQRRTRTAAWGAAAVLAALVSFGAAGGAAAQGSVATDRAALVALYHATDGPNWRSNYNWLSDEPLNRWAGVYTDRAGRVVRLHLGGYQLSGPIPSELGRLASLWLLYLHENQLSGPIPSELGRLANLEELTLSANQLSGPIPSELGRLASLEMLWLGENQLSGPIPSELGRLANLGVLWLDHDTGLCLPADFPESPFLTKAREESVPTCGGDKPPRPVEQTQAECLNDAGMRGGGSSAAWDPVIGPCVKADDGDVASFEDFVEACRLCWLLHDALEARGECVAGLILVFVEVVLVAETVEPVQPTIEIPTGSGIVIDTPRRAEPSITSGVAHGLSLKFGCKDGDPRCCPPGMKCAHGGDGTVKVQSTNAAGLTVKVQSTNTTALAASFRGDGALLLHYDHAEPAELVWTLMDGDTPLGSLVLPYEPSPAVVPALPLFGVFMLSAGLVGLGWFRFQAKGAGARK